MSSDGVGRKRHLQCLNMTMPLLHTVVVVSLDHNVFCSRKESSSDYCSYGWVFNIRELHGSARFSRVPTTFLKAWHCLSFLKLFSLSSLSPGRQFSSRMGAKTAPVAASTTSDASTVSTRRITHAIPILCRSLTKGAFPSVTSCSGPHQ